jgi:hypothetical protein
LLLPPLALLLLPEDEAPDDELFDGLCFGAPEAFWESFELEPPGEPPAAAELPPFCGGAANTGPLPAPGLAADIGVTAAAKRTAELDACA